MAKNPAGQKVNVNPIEGGFGWACDCGDTGGQTWLTEYDAAIEAGLHLSDKHAVTLPDLAPGWTRRQRRT